MDIDEKRIYADQREATVAYVASEQGVTVVELSGGRVGRFHLADRTAARDVATGEKRAYVATETDVLAGLESFDGLDFGVAVAVGASDGVSAAGPDGRVARYDDEAWTDLGSVEGVRAVDGDLVAAADGVYRLADGGEYVGLDDARDVAAGESVLAATGDGLYRLANGWERDRSGTFRAVTVGEDRSYAATADALYEPVDDGEQSAGDGGDAGWRELAVPSGTGAIVDVAVSEAVYAVTEDGTVLVNADPERTADGAGGWRTRALGVRPVTGLAVL
jgi:hypothetical protein